MHPEGEVKRSATGTGRSRSRIDRTQYETAQKKRTMAAALIIFILIPATMIGGMLLFDQGAYMVISILVIIYTLIPFFMVFEKRKPRAREIVLIAMMAALTTVLQLFFHITIPVQAGTAMVIISGIALGPEAGFLIGALARLVCNFYMGQGPWTPWQMFCWGLLGFLAGLAFNKMDPEKLRSYRRMVAAEKEEGHEEEVRLQRGGPLMQVNSRSFRIVFGPVLCVAFALLAAYISYFFRLGEEGSFLGWRLYVFGAVGLLAGVLLQRKRLPADGLTMGLFTLFVTFIIYGGIMNVCAMINSSVMPGGRPVNFETLRLLYITGAPYDGFHAVTAAIFVFFFGDLLIRKLERIKIKYGIYR